MFYKISNIAQKEVIENKFNAIFDFPNLFESESIIEGLNEATICLITMANPDKITFGIWGLLPEDFEDNWSVFQNVYNTLNVKYETLKNNEGLFTDILKDRRCIIISTGFFTSLLSRGTIEQCHVHLSNFEPFAIAAVFNELEDGFLTCSMVVTKASESFKEIPNISNLKPLVLNNDELKQWLNSSTTLNEIDELIERHRSQDFQYKSVSSGRPITGPHY